MQPIDPTQLSSVRGGFGALLGSLAQSAGPILNGVAGIIGAAKSGKGGGAAAAGPPSAGPSPMPSSDPEVSVAVSINGVPQR